MITEAYCLDDGSLAGVFSVPDFQSKLEVLIGVAENLFEDGKRVLVTDAIDTVIIGDGVAFFDLYNADFSDADVWHDIDRDLVTRFVNTRLRFDKIDTDHIAWATYYRGGAALCDEYETGLAGAIEIVRDEADCVGILGYGDRIEPGACEFRIRNGGDTAVYFLRSKSDLLLHTRWMLDVIAPDEEEFFRLWDRAFPNLIKSDALTFSKFHGDFGVLREDVVRHLGFLNDQFIRIWTDCGMDFPCLKARARTGYAVDFSNESVRTRSSEKKMKKRDVSYKGMSVRCELHTKLSPRINRIHFHPPVPPLIGDNKVFIGIFVDHLET